jgi:hypothetical protein
VIDPRRVFLARAAARLILVEAVEMTLAEAFDGLMPFAERWGGGGRQGRGESYPQTAGRRRQ